MLPGKRERGRGNGECQEQHLRTEAQAARSWLARTCLSSDSLSSFSRDILLSRLSYCLLASSRSVSAKCTDASATYNEGLASTWAHQQRLVGAASRPAPCNPFYVSACTCVNKSSCRHWRQVSPACVVDPRVAPQNKPAQFLDLRLRNSAQCRVSGA